MSWHVSPPKRSKSDRSSRSAGLARAVGAGIAVGARRVPSRLAMVCLGVVVLAGGGCQQRRVRVEMAPDEQGMNRSFATNTLDKAGRARLAEAYGRDAKRDQGTGGVRVAGTFADSLPSEVGNQSGITTLDSDLGRTWFYFESFLGDPNDPLGLERDDWVGLQRRMAAGELWIRLFGRWAERQIADPSKREEFRAYIDADLVPLANNTMLRYGAMQAAAQSNRVGATIRERQQSGPRTPEEAFWQRLFVPLLLCLAECDQAARSARPQAAGAVGLFTAEETHQLLLLSLDGNAGGASRAWSLEEIFLPAMARQVRRFRPQTTRITTADLLAIGISFFFHTSSSRDRDALMLDSAAFSEDEKARIRGGDRSVALPPPYGLDPRRTAKSTRAEVRLKTRDEPYLTNGVWNPAEGEVVFDAALHDALNRTVLYQPIYYAAWSRAAESRQQACFGRIIMRGDALANYCIWLEVLGETRAAEWTGLVDRLAASGSDSGTGTGSRRSAITAMKRFVDDARADRVPPEALRTWLGEAASSSD